MEKNLILIKLCYKFSKKYMAGYLGSLAKPIAAAILGFLLLGLIKIDTKFVLLSLCSIPLCCYAFWKGYLYTYGLIPCAHDFIKHSSLSFEDYKKQACSNEAGFAKFVCFSAFLTLLLYIPAALYIIKTIPFSIDMLLDTNALMNYFKPVDNAILVNTILLAPFLNYFLCAFYYKKEDENYFSLFLNCYKKLNIIGVILCTIITLIGYKGGIIYLLVALILNPFIYSINTFWYLSRENK